MNKIYLLLLLASTINVSGHTDTTFVKFYNNIRVVTTTGDNYEEVNKTYIIGQYLNLLCKEYKFKDSITVDFRHSYTYNRDQNFSITQVNKNYVISYRSNTFNIINTLKIFDFILKNETSKKLESLGLNSLNEIFNKNPSKFLDKIIKSRIYRPTELPNSYLNYGYSYYVENNKFYIYKLKTDNTIEVKLVIDNVYQITEVNSKSIIVFDSRETFYLISDNSVSNKVHFSNKDNYYNIYKLLSVSYDVISIKLSKPYNQEKIIIYVKSKNKIIEI